MIRPGDKRGAMRSEDQGAARGKSVERGENRGFRLFVESRCDFIEDHKGARLEEGACESEAAALAGGQRLAARAERCGEPGGQRGEEAAERRLLKGGAQGAFRRALLPEADVFGERGVV